MQGIPVVPGFNGFGYDMNQFRQAMANASMPYVNPGFTNPLTTQQNFFMPQAQTTVA